jgi:signal transduction histidine kinase
LSVEVERINKLESTHATLMIKGDIKPFNVDIKIIVYRIIQEFICNTIKHAAATKLTIVLNYNNDNFVLEIADNGKGFNMLDKLKCGSGVSNIKNRAALIGAECIFNSDKNGTRLTIIINNYTQN